MDESIVGMIEEINEESNKRRWKTKAEKNYEAFIGVLRETRYNENERY